MAAVGVGTADQLCQRLYSDEEITTTASYGEVSGSSIDCVIWSSINAKFSFKKVPFEVKLNSTAKNSVDLLTTF